ncbi:serine/threonine-protein kinase [Kribbella sp. NPDC059898]|uniref:serine/threonine-protein kinase n=1 Tax=Kribbella sp. NPDC059898 TaxID=3346995 RepID=UPI00365060A8
MMERLTNEDPATLGPYRLIARIGQGGMGVVYLAEAGAGNVAVKVLRAELARDPAFLARFRREIAVCQQVGGVCCAHYLDADVDASPPWLATEYVTGPTLAEHVGGRGPVSDLMLVGLAAGIAEGLVAIHRVGLVHRDLKPANVILSLEGPRLIDFGIAHHADATALTAPGTVVGSPGWMAPEQLRGDRIGPAADVWAWGATVAYAATGKSPFGSGSAPEIAQRVLAGLPDLTAVPESLAGRVRAALSPDPADRPSAADLIADATTPTSPDAITTVLAETWRPIGTLLLTQPTHQPAGLANGSTAGNHRRRWLVPAGAAAAVAVVAALGAGLLHDRQASTSHQPTTQAVTPPAVSTSTPAPQPSPSAQTSLASLPQTVATTNQWSMAKFRPSATEASMSGTFRAFSDRPNYIANFPLTMNGCASRAMRTHWRTLGQKVTVGTMYYSDTPDTATASDATNLTTATSGWIDTGGCEQPAFFVPHGSASTLVDIAFETRIYDAAP